MGEEVHILQRCCVACHVLCCSILNKFGRSFETMTDTYDPTTGVIKREKSKLKVSHQCGRDTCCVRKYSNITVGLLLQLCHHVRVNMFW